MTHVTACALSNHPLSVSEIKQSMYRFHVVNLGLVKPDVDTPWERCDDFAVSLEHVYRGWKAWVSESYDSEWHIRRRCLHAKAAEQVTSCTPKAVHGWFDVVERVLVELDLYKDGCLVDTAARALWVADEKGLESLPGKVKQQKIVAPKCCGSKGTTSVVEGCFGHISLLPFLALGRAVFLEK